MPRTTRSAFVTQPVVAALRLFDSAHAACQHRLEQARSRVAETVRFWDAWRGNPRAVGAIVPSGQGLARAMTAQIPIGKGSILELGAGTGAFTRALLARGIHERDLVLIEREPVFLEALRYEFPSARVQSLDAARLPATCMGQGGPAAATVCGLPMLNMGTRTQMRILAGAFAQMAPNAPLFLFTYGPYCPVRRQVLHRLGLKAVRAGAVLANLPPAGVWKITRRGFKPISRSAVAGTPGSGH